MQRFDESIGDFNEAIKLNPKNDQAFHYRGNALYNESRFLEALESLDEAIKLNPSAELFLLRSYANGQLLKLKEAIADLDEVIRLKPSVESFQERGYLKMGIHSFEEAIKDFDDALRLDPKSTSAYQNRGYSKHALGRYEGAIKDYRAVLTMEPNNSLAYNNSCWTKTFLGEYKEAIMDCNKAIELDPEDPSYYDSRGWTHFNAGNFKESIKDYSSSVRLGSNSDYTYAKLGLTQIRMGSYTDALNSANQAVVLDESYYYTYVIRGIAQFYLGNVEEAAADLVKSDSLALTRSLTYPEANEYEKLRRELGGLFEKTINNRTSTPEKVVSKKVALVIGVKSYTAVPPLVNTLNDAKDVAAMLRKKGFDVIELLDPRTKSEMRTAAINFSKALENYPDGVGMLYYSGHGMQIDGANYLIPAGATLEVKADVQEQCMDMDYFLRIMEANGNHLNIVVLDACRNNPFRSFSRAADKGLSMVSAPKGSYIVYSTKPGSVASDGVGRNGLFTSKLLKYLNEPALSIEQVFKKVAADVSADSNDAQRPWISSDYTGEFYFTSKK